MNRIQQVIVIIGVVLVILSGLFPPYEGEFHPEGLNYKQYMGYHFLFVPPSGAEVFRAIFDREWDVGGQQYHSRYSSHIILSQVSVQVVTVVIATVGLFLVFGVKRKE
jgi:hypothetical protein